MDTPPNCQLEGVYPQCQKNITFLQKKVHVELPTVDLLVLVYLAVDVPVDCHRGDDDGVEDLAVDLGTFLYDA